MKRRRRLKPRKSSEQLRATDITSLHDIISKNTEKGNEKLRKFTVISRANAPRYLPVKACICARAQDLVAFFS